MWRHIIYGLMCYVLRHQNDKTCCEYSNCTESDSIIPSAHTQTGLLGNKHLCSLEPEQAQMGGEEERV
jgi:hypothetical protein